MHADSGLQAAMYLLIWRDAKVVGDAGFATTLFKVNDG